jgi:galactokinase
LLLLRAAHPELAGRLTHLRDVNPTALGVTAARIYDMLAALPEAPTRKQLIDALGREALMPIFATHDAPREGYPVRGVAAFVVSEVARADRCARLLQKGNARAFGRMMNVSHDGDRVSADGRPWRADVSAGALRRLGRARAPLWRLPGAYACSTERIDRIVDIALDQPGVAGAQICGAGLGGAAAILVREDAAEGLRQALDDDFYRPARLRPQMLLCRPVAGAGTVRVK